MFACLRCEMEMGSCCRNVSEIKSEEKENFGGNNEDSFGGKNEENFFHTHL